MMYWIHALRVVSDTDISIDVAAVITAICGGIGVLIGVWYSSRKSAAEARKLNADAHKVDAEADSTAVTAANDLIRTMQGEITALKARVEGLENDVRRERLASNEISIKYHQALNRIVELETEIRTMRRQLDEANIEIAKHRQQLAGAAPAEKMDGTG